MIKFSKITWLAIALIIAVCATGFFVYQWWQVKGELGRQIAQNENLTKQIDELQKQVEELKAAKEKIIDETADWKTYRNEKFGFEIDYPTVGWEFTEGEITHPHVFSICKEQEDKKKFRFCIYGEIWPALKECFNYNCEYFITNAYRCFLRETYPSAVRFKKEIILTPTVKGCKTIRNFPGEGITVFFPLKRMTVNGPELRLVLLLTYYKDAIHTHKEIETFEKVVSTFRFIEE